MEELVEVAVDIVLLVFQFVFDDGFAVGFSHLDDFYSAMDDFTERKGLEVILEPIIADLVGFEEFVDKLDEPLGFKEC